MIDEALSTRIREAAAEIMKRWGKMPDERLAASMAQLADEVTQIVGVPVVAFPTPIGIIVYAVPVVRAAPSGCAAATNAGSKADR